MLNFLKISFLLIMFVFITGCGSTNHLTIAEQIAKNEKEKEMSKYFFNDVNKIQVAGAIEKVLRLSDGNDYSISYQESKIDVKRTSVIYLVFYAGIKNDRWEIFLEEKNNGVYVSIKTYVSSQEMVAVFPEREIVKGDLYNLFFNRIEYILGRNTKWQSCEEVEKLNPNIDYSLLCFMATDTNPTLPKN